jgi:hypothetical protein
MKKVTKISDILEQRAFDSSLEFFWIANNEWKVTTDISTKKYKNLIHNIYKIHKMNNNIYDFQNDIEEYLYTSLLIAINDKSHVIDREKFLDSIFEVEIKKRGNNDYSKDSRRGNNGRKCR